MYNIEVSTCQRPRYIHTCPTGGRCRDKAHLLQWTSEQPGKMRTPAQRILSYLTGKCSVSKEVKSEPLKKEPVKRSGAAGCVVETDDLWRHDDGK